MAARPAVPTALAALLVASLLAAGVAGTATASARPVDVCNPCADGFVDAAAAGGVDAEVRIERSTATMRVHRNGTATWTVRNRLNPAAATALRNASLRRSVAANAVAVHDGRLLSTSLDGDVVRLRYRTPAVATAAPGGVLRVDYFRDDPGSRIRGDLGADRLTLVAPAGLVVDRSLPGAETSGRRLTVTAFESDGDGPFVTLVPRESALGPLWSLVAVALPLAPIVGRNLLLRVALPAAVFAGGLGALARLVRVVGPAPGAASPERRALGVVVLGALVLAHPLFPAVLGLGGPEPALAAGAVGLIVLGGGCVVPGVRNRGSLRSLGAVVGIAFAAAVAVGLLLRTLSIVDVRPDLVRWTLPALPVYAAAVTGAAVARDRLRLGLGVAAGAFALVIVASLPLASKPGSFYLLGVVGGVIGAVAGVLAGTPPFLVGYALPDDDEPPAA
jgi:hypothetical protein